MFIADIKRVVEQVSRDKGIDVEILIRALEEALLNFPGTVLVISHDRGLLNRAVEGILHLHDRKLTLTEISFMLGFSEMSSFSRAFKRWTGESPKEFRRLD